MNGEAWLQRLEKLWLDQPGRVIRIIERGIHTVELTLLARTFPGVVVVVAVFS